MVEPPAPAPVCVQGAVSLESSPSRLLTTFEYDNTIATLFGDATLPRAAFPAENRTFGLDNDARNHSVSPLLVDQQVQAAEAIASAVVALGKLEVFGCPPAEMNQACLAGFLESFLTRAFRRPPTPEETRVFLDLYAMGESAEDSLELVIQAALISPQFLYRIEPAAAVDADVYVPADAYELATRLSYFVTGSMPDRPLLAKAKSKELLSDEVLASEARRLFRTLGARSTVRHFAELWLGVDELSRSVKDASTFPEWDPAMRSLLRTSMGSFVEDVVFRVGTFEGLMTDRGLWLNAMLAPVYGFEAPTRAGFFRFEAPREQRAGILTQPALMTRYSLPSQTSPIQRGVFVLDAILCDPAEPPPPVAVVPPDPDPRASTRERFRQHTANAACARCHVRIDPVGFGFEAFDGIGRFRAMENGAPVDASGSIVEVREDAIEGEFDGAVELAGRLAHSRQAASCFATRWFRYAIGRVEGRKDFCSLENVKAAFVDSGGRFEELVVSIVLSDVFRLKAKGD